MKKLLTILLIILILVTVGVLIGFLMIKNSPQGENIGDTIKNFFPFGNPDGQNNVNKNGGLPGEEKTSRNEGTITQAPVPKFRKVAESPVAGFTVFNKTDDETSDLIHYVDKATGNVYEAETGALGVKRLTNTTIPKVYDALWANKDEVILRYLRDDGSIETYYGKIEEKIISGEDVVGELTGTFLPSNIRDMAVSPAGNKIFYIITDDSGAAGFISNPDGTKSAKIFTSPISEWLSEWPEETAISLVTKPAGGINGLFYLLNTKTGSLDKILDGINGLTVLINSNLMDILYSESPKNGVSLKTYSISKKEGAVVKNIKTLPEKCVWSVKKSNIAYCGANESVKLGIYPDSWYKGIVSFEDKIWMIDVDSGSATMVADIAGMTENKFDAIKLELSPDEDHLLFVNKTDSTLWSLRLSEPAELSED